MRANICKWCRACIMCATRQAGRAPKPLVPIPVDGPFDQIGVDIIQFPKSKKGNRYTVIFMDYLIKWVKAFTTRDQSALTIAKLLVGEVISRHGVSKELLFDREASFPTYSKKSIVSWESTKYPQLHITPRPTGSWSISIEL